jgi:Spy/CpxP family protein refolding chaperone
LLADLQALRALQQEQERALRAGDAERVEHLCARGEEIIARIGTVAPGGSADRDAARALAPEVRESQARLETLAAEMRRAILERLRTLGPGREALASYRPPSRDNARWVDGAH